MVLQEVGSMRNISKQTPLIYWVMVGIARWMRTPVATLVLTIGLIVTLRYGRIDTLVGLVTIWILIFAQIARFLVELCRALLGKKKLDRQFVITCVAAVLPVLLILNIRTIDYVISYAVVRVAEPYVLSQAEKSSLNHSDDNSSFKYFRTPWLSGLWLVYDESGQVLQDYQMRNAEWWRISKESQEGESCFSNGRRLYSNFYLQYFRCN